MLQAGPGSWLGFVSAISYCTVKGTFLYREAFNTYKGPCLPSDQLNPNRAVWSFSVKQGQLMFSNYIPVRVQTRGHRLCQPVLLGLLLLFSEDGDLSDHIKMHHRPVLHTGPSVRHSEHHWKRSQPVSTIQPEDSDGLPSGSNYSSTLRINNLHDNRLHSLMPSHTSSTLSLVLSDRWSKSPCRLCSYGFVLAIPAIMQHFLLGHSRYRADTLLTQLPGKPAWFLEKTSPSKQMQRAFCSQMQMTSTYHPFLGLLCGLAGWPQVILRLEIIQWHLGSFQKMYLSLFFWLWKETSQDQGDVTPYTPLHPCKGSVPH